MLHRVPIIAKRQTRKRKEKEKKREEEEEGEERKGVRRSARRRSASSQRVHARIRFLHCCLAWIAGVRAPPYYYHSLPRTCFLLRSSNTSPSPSFSICPPPSLSIFAINRPLQGLLSTSSRLFHQRVPFCNHAFFLRRPDKNASINVWHETTHLIPRLEK